MTIEHFDYDLPPHLIAQHPATERDASRLMVLHRDTGHITHKSFSALPELLNPGDLLVLNDTRVLPARVIGHRESTGGKWEGLFLKVTPEGMWEMLAQTGGRPTIGEAIVIEPGPFKLILRGRAEQYWLMEPQAGGKVGELLAAHGHMPLPPYIRKGRDEDADRERYQTIFAKHDGSVAAPTAGLHFTPALFDRLKARGISWAYVTLHVGLGTFEPIRAEDPTQHVMHQEWGAVPPATAEAIRVCKQAGKRVIAVGTTATRALESAARSGNVESWSGETNLYIYPPYEFRVLDGLITNFHLPRTTLLLLVGAFAGMDLLRRAYESAVKMEYRFYSYGDAMLIL
jgi:S-adenosylmethionine:tRNA ribosyltransferase-isomerase